MCYFSSSAAPIDVSDWSVAIEEETWQDQHAKTRVDRQDLKVEAVITATCSDDGLINIWRPLEVSRLSGYFCLLTSGVSATNTMAG